MQTKSRTTVDLRESLESAIDCWGLPEILLQLSIICDGKADHISENWQPLTVTDRQNIKNWHKIGDCLFGLSDSPNLPQ